MSEPTYERLRQEAEFWHEQHRKLVKEVDKLAWSTPHHETSERLMALKYEHANALHPSPLDIDRVKEWFRNKKIAEEGEHG